MLVLKNSPPLESPVAVAVSGGADSMALLLLLKEQGYAVTALTVDHGLRTESAKEALQVKQWAAAYNVSHHILKWEQDGRMGNIQEQARTARYDLMTAWCRENNTVYLATGHHQQDQAETVLHRLQRGTGVKGLEGMRVISQRNGIVLWRPLLNTSPEYLRPYLKKKKQSWIEDPSNQDRAYTRVKIRHDILPVLEQYDFTVERLASTAQAAQDTNDALDWYAAQLLNDCQYAEKRGSISFNRIGWITHPYETRRRALIQFLASKDIPQPRGASISTLLSWIQECDAGKRTLAGGIWTCYPQHFTWEAEQS